MKLPDIRYGDSIVKQTRVKFGGYYHSLYAQDGDIYDMKNITSDQFPLIMPRLQREVYPIARERRIFYDSSFTFGSNYIIIVLNEKSVINSLDRVRLEFENGSGFLQNAGTYIVSGVSAQEAENTYKITFYNADFKTGTASEESKMTVTVDGITNESQTSSVTERLPDSETKVTAPDTSYNLSGETFTRKVYSVTNTAIYTKTTTVTKNTVTGYEDMSSYSEADWRVNSKSTNYAVLESYTSADNTNLYNTIKDGRNKIVISNGDITVTAYVNNCESNGSYTIKLYDFDFSDLVVSDNRVWTITVYKAIKTFISSEETQEEVIDQSGLSGSTVYTFDDTTSVETKTETVYSDYRYKVMQTTDTTVWTYSEIPIEVMSAGSGDVLYMTDRDGYFYYDGVIKGKLSADVKTFYETGAFIWIMPDRKYYNKSKGIIEENIAYSASQRFSDTYGYMWELETNTLSMWTNSIAWEGISAKYSVGNTVKIIVTDTDSKKYEYSASIVSIGVVSKRGTLTFADGTFTSIAASKIQRIIISLDMPDLKYVCAANNRIWGCNDDTIFCTVFGQPFNWFEYSASNSGNVGDIAWSITPFSSGKFTGCVTYRDTPVFFTDDKIIVVNGTRASNFELSTTEAPGVMEGAEKTITVLNDAIYYLSNQGIIKYYAYTPVCISEEFYEHFTGGCSGHSGNKLYMTLKNDDVCKLFVYDVKKRIWCREDDFDARSYTYFSGKLLGVGTDGVIYVMNPITESRTGIDSFIEFGDYYCSSPDKKVISKLYLRLSIETGGSVEVSMNYDSQKNEKGERIWHSIKTISASSKKSVILPIIPKRCDHFRIKLSGSGGFVLYSLSHEYYNGTFM